MNVNGTPDQSPRAQRWLLHDDRERYINELIDYDILTIEDERCNDCYDYLRVALRGDGWTQYGNMSDDDLVDEHRVAFGDN